jgi:hypothetical protein
MSRSSTIYVRNQRLRKWLATNSKSVVRKGVLVRVRPGAPHFPHVEDV